MHIKNEIILIILTRVSKLKINFIKKIDLTLLINTQKFYTEKIKINKKKKITRAVQFYSN